MCGRYVSASSPQEIADYFGATTVTESLTVADASPDPAPGAEANFNVAPTTAVPAIRHLEGERHLDVVRWGLIPSWAKSKNIGAKMINARSETVTTKNAFRAAAKRRRCVIPADAFYEWTAEANPDGKKPLKQPWCIQRVDGDMMAFAGLFEFWRDSELGDDAPLIRSCTVLTREANEAMAPIHDRMPVMLAPHRWDEWMSPDSEDVGALLASIEAVPSELLTIYPVATAVNNSRSRGAELMTSTEPLGDDHSWNGSHGRVPVVL